MKRSIFLFFAAALLALVIADESDKESESPLNKESMIGYLKSILEHDNVLPGVSVDDIKDMEMKQLFGLGKEIAQKKLERSQAEGNEDEAKIAKGHLEYFQNAEQGLL